MQVQTNPFVFLADADFVPSGTAGEQYRYFSKDNKNALGRIRENWEQKSLREVLIIPAFERLKVNANVNPESSPCHEENPTCWVYENLDIPYTKPKLMEMVDNGGVESFYNTRVRRR